MHHQSSPFSSPHSPLLYDLKVNKHRGIIIKCSKKKKKNCLQCGSSRAAEENKSWKKVALKGKEKKEVGRGRKKTRSTKTTIDAFFFFFFLLFLSQFSPHSSLASSLVASPRAHVVSLLSGCARRPMPRVRPAATRVRYLSFRFFFFGWRWRWR